MSAVAVDIFRAEDMRPWLFRAAKILFAMAGEGVCIEGQEDPGDYILELIDALGQDDWDEALRVLGEGEP